MARRHVTRTRTAGLALIRLTLLLGGASQPLFAQSIQLLGGTSSVSDVTGGGMTIRGSGYEAAVGVGVVGGELRAGTLVRVQRRVGVFSAGDEALNLSLPTDPGSGGGAYLPLRALGFTRESTRGSVAVRVGYSALDSGTSFFRSAKAVNPVSVLFADRRLGRHWRLASRSILSDTRTSIQSVEWKPGDLTVAASGGAAASDPYAAIRAALQKPWLTGEVGYVASSTPFRDLVARAATTAERTGLSARVAVTPAPGWSLRAGHERLIAPTALHTTGQRTVDDVTAAVDASGTRLSGGVYVTSGDDRRSVGTRVAVGRRFGERFDAGTEYLASGVDGVPLSHSWITTLRQSLGPRFSVVQVIARSDSQTTVRLGGSITSNLATVSLDYQTMHAPFSTGEAFVNTLVLSARLNPIADWQIQASTYTLPNGRPRFMVSVGRFLFRGRGRSPRSVNAPAAGRAVPKYLVRGRVVDEGGAAVGGAVMTIGGQTVIAAEDGRFYARFASKRSIDVAVNSAEFSGPHRIAVVSAPAQAHPTTDDTAAEMAIVVRRMIP